MCSGSHKSRIFCIAAVVVCLVFAIGTGQASAKTNIVFADAGWDSIQVHNRIAGFILENGYGYDIDFIPGETIPLFQGVVRGDIDIDMEVWVENQQEAVDKALASGEVMDLGSNFPDSWQGWLVPTYVVKGDPERGIEPMAPGLKSVSDLPKYAKLFKDVEDPGKGRFYSCIAGWECEKINEKKFEAYDLDEHFNIFLPGSNAALVASLAGAYKKGEPWFGYYWAPTWVLGTYDMTPLEEPPFDPETFKSTAACAYPAVKVNIFVNSGLQKKAPDVVSFLKKYETTQDMANMFLSYMEEKNADIQDAAHWFLKNFEDVWTAWVPVDVAAKVRKALS